MLDRGGCIWAPVQTMDELAADAQVLANGYLAEVTHERHGGFRLVNVPMRFGRTPARARGAAPELGQHTDDTLLSLGYTWDEIIAMKERVAVL